MNSADGMAPMAIFAFSDKLEFEPNVKKEMLGKILIERSKQDEAAHLKALIEMQVNRF